MTRIAINDLRDLCLKALQNAGVSEEHAIITVDHYLENELSGKTSHGMVRVVEAVHYIKKMGLPEKDIEFVQDNGTIAVLEANYNLGTVAALKCMEKCIDRTKKHGLSFVGVRNYFASTGSMAYFLRRFAEQNLIAIIGCNSVGLVAAPAGKDRILGTNPLGMAFPSADGNHFIGDIATSAIALGKVMVIKDKGEQVPEGKLIDGEGNPSTNPDHAFFGTEGAILPMENYHGFSLALMITLLGGTLLGAKDIKMDIYDSDGFFMMGLDPKAFGLDDAPSSIQKTLNEIRTGAPAPGHDHVSIPGDRSAAILKQTLESGVVDVADKTLQDIQDLVIEKTA